MEVRAMKCRSALMTIATTLLAALGVLPTPQALLAQPAGESRPLFLAIPDAFPDIDARAVVVRESAREIVLLRVTDTSAETLDLALAVLQRVRGQPVEPGRGVMVPITGYAVTRPMGEVRRRKLDGVLRSLAAQPPARVGNLGPGRSMQYREDAGRR
jgi:hypothetical protein